MVRIVHDRVTIRVPATSANLGPGFDSFGVALDLWDEIEVHATSDSNVKVEIEGHGAETVARDESHLVIRALHTALEAVGAPLTGVVLKAKNRIPHGRGLGSSAAACVAGIAAAHYLISEPELLDGPAMLALANDFEGHPDNAAPAIYGGGTISWIAQDLPQTAHLSLSPDLGLVTLVPGNEFPTKQARAVLPEQVPHGVAAAQAARAGLLVAALGGQTEHLLAATEDYLHQGFRGEVMPHTRDLIAKLRDAGFAAVISGAGPSVLVLVDQAKLPDPAAAVRTAAAELAEGWEISARNIASGVRGARR